MAISFAIFHWVLTALISMYLKWNNVWSDNVVEQFFFLHDTRFLVSKNHAYKNIEAQISFKYIVVILLVAIPISFPASDEI